MDASNPRMNVPLIINRTNVSTINTVYVKTWLLGLVVNPQVDVLNDGEFTPTHLQITSDVLAPEATYNIFSGKWTPKYTRQYTTYTASGTPKFEFDIPNAKPLVKDGYKRPFMLWMAPLGRSQSEATLTLFDDDNNAFASSHPAGVNFPTNTVRRFGFSIEPDENKFVEEGEGVLLITEHLRASLYNEWDYIEITNRSMEDISLKGYYLVKQLSKDAYTPENASVIDLNTLVENGAETLWDDEAVGVIPAQTSIILATMPKSNTSYKWMFESNRTYTRNRPDLSRLHQVYYMGNSNTLMVAFKLPQVNNTAAAYFITKGGTSIKYDEPNHIVDNFGRAADGRSFLQFPGYRTHLRVNAAHNKNAITPKKAFDFNFWNYQRRNAPNDAGKYAWQGHPFGSWYLSRVR